MSGTVAADAELSAHEFEGDVAPRAIRGNANGSAAAWAFGIVEVLAFPLLVFWGRGIWFNVDDWDFLASRQAGNVGDWFRPHFSHLTTIPILVYRFVFWFGGMRSYVPYQVLIIVFHLGAALLLRLIMRRAGVSAWIATSAATLFVFFGAGAENILVAFQITFVGALAFGFAQLMLSDHDGPFDRRDAWGLAAGFVALLFSGVGVAMAGVVGIATLLRRGWRIALLHTVPLGLAYIVWSITAPKTQTPYSTTTDVWRCIEFALIGLRSGFGQLGPFWGAGVLTVVMLAAGLRPVLTRRGRRTWDKRLAVPIAMLIGAPVFLVLTAFGRSGDLDAPKSALALKLAAGAKAVAQGPQHAQQSRYVYIVVALLLPAIVVGAEALAQRWRILAVAIPAFFLLAIPVNIVRFTGFRSPSAGKPQDQQTVLRAPYLPNASLLPRSLLVVPYYARGATMGWLIDNSAAGKLPHPVSTPPLVMANLALQYGLSARLTFPNKNCHTLTGPIDQVLATGDVFTVKSGTVGVQYAPPGGVASAAKVLHDKTLVVIGGPLPLRVTPIADAPTDTAPTAIVCD